ncbi:hypothetical protein BDQ17DRAFT_789388 [Cyathus striatus]|nr:hypothetical protein BDQ17DRAFT_789388 [Cyathus striatus]
MLGMRELTEVWVGELDMGDDGEREIKLEPGQGDDLLPSHSRSPQKRARHSTTSSATPSGIVLPPLSIYYPLPPIAPPGTSSSSSAAFPSTPSSSSSSYTFPNTSSSHNTNPQVTPELLRRLPDLQDAVRLLDACSDVLRIRPVPLLGGWKGFEKRCMEVLRRGKKRERDRDRERGKERDKEREKRERAREIYFSSASPSTSTSSTSPPSVHDEEEEEGALPLFASLCAALFLGASSLPNTLTPPSQATSPEFLYALSQQALGVWDTHRAAHMGSNTGEYSRREERERVDYLTACLLGVEGMLLRGRGRRGKEVSEVVGKMVNVARSMGMSDISCPVPTGFSWEGEADAEEVKKMLWWDTVFYDLFISDTQGQAPLIAPLSTFNHGDEQQDDDDELSDVPMNATDDTSTEKQRDMMRYFTVRCRLTQLARTIKYRIANPDCCCGYTLDQAVSLASQIHKFQSSLPKSLQYSPITATAAYSPPSEPSQEDSYDIHQPALHLDQEMGEKIAQAQAAEICVMVQILTLRVYAPFLRPTGAANAVGAGASAGAGAPGSASHACVAAASCILRSTRALHNAIKTPAHGYPGVVHPTTLDFYPLEHTVFLACVICAHAGLTGKAVSD